MWNKTKLFGDEIYVMDMPKDMIIVSLEYIKKLFISKFYFMYSTSEMLLMPSKV